MQLTKLALFLLRIRNFLYREIFLKRLYGWWYKPHAYYETAELFMQKAHKQPKKAIQEVDKLPTLTENFCISVVPAYTSVITNPSHIAFYAHCNSTMYVIKNNLIETISDNFVLNLVHGRVQTDVGANTAIISPDNYIVGEVSFQYDDKKGSVPVYYNKFFRNSFAYPLKRYKGVVFSAIVGGGSNTNYFHWLVDTVSRFYLLKQLGLWQQIDYFYMPNYELPFQKESLALLGITPEKIINAQHIRHLQATTLLCSHISRPRGHFPIWIWQGLRELFLPICTSSSTVLPKKLLYVSRQDTTYRKIQNEIELLNLLKSYEFEILILSQLSFKTQVELFSCAAVVIAQHGAGLTNIIFSPIHTVVIELYGGLVNPDFAGICQTGNLNHIGFACEVTESSGAGIFYKENTFVDIEQLEIILKQNLHTY